jgi:hypothetical protein
MQQIFMRFLIKLIWVRISSEGEGTGIGYKQYYAFSFNTFSILSFSVS